MAPPKALPLRPAQYAEHRLITSILDSTYPPGAALPAERVLAEQIGVTRQTLRETLQRLASEGWVTIHHGKSTVVNDYWKAGGLRMLGTTAKYGEFLSKGFIRYLLEARMTIFPAVAGLAAKRDSDTLIRHLEGYRDLDDRPRSFVEFDWKLQVLIAGLSGNPVYPLILNDFASIFKMLAPWYFSLKTGRQASRSYYRKLHRTLKHGPADVENIVREALAKSVRIWDDVTIIKEEYRGAMERRG